MTWTRAKRRTPSALLLLVAGCASAASAARPPAGPGEPPAVPRSTLERVRARGSLRCGGAARPGLAEGGPRPRGLEVELCRAVAAAALGSPDRIHFALYDTPKEYGAVRLGAEDLFFLTGTEVAEHQLAGLIVPGPTVFLQSEAVLVHADSAAAHVADLAGGSICFVIGSSAERSLEATFEALGKGFRRMPYSEVGEMVDAYDVGRCRAVAAERTELARFRLQPGVNRIGSRVLPEPLSLFPIFAATGTGDGRWSALVAWTLDTLVSGERPRSRWYAGGAGAMPVAAPELGLGEGWQRRVLEAVGDYGVLYGRTLGRGSPYRLDRGVDANQAAGGLLLAPFLE